MIDLDRLLKLRVIVARTGEMDVADRTGDKKLQVLLKAINEKIPTHAVSADIMEHVDPIFFGDPKTAAMKVLGG